jgi:hypothetical protein
MYSSHKPVFFLWTKALSIFSLRIARQTRPRHVSHFLKYFILGFLFRGGGRGLYTRCILELSGGYDFKKLVRALQTRGFRT